MEEDIIHVGFVAGRHALLFDGHVWTEDIPDPTDFQALYSTPRTCSDDVSEM